MSVRKPNENVRFLAHAHSIVLSCVFLYSRASEKIMHVVCDIKCLAQDMMGKK